MQSPRLYATFLLWMLSELFEELPEAGDLPKPKLVFFFDEAHLLFNDAPKALMDKIEQVVRLIRSKGVGVYFVTQNPIDVPDKVLAQLGGRVQHALRAFTPRDQKAVAAAAQTFRPNPKLDTARVIMELGKGEALVSFLEGGGTPTMVERVMIRPPTARIGPITPEERKAIMNKSPVKGKYDTAVDAESAYEMLQKRVAGTAAPADGSRRRSRWRRWDSGAARCDRRHHLRHQRQARPALDRPGHCARCHPLGYQQGDRRRRCRSRQIGRRVARRLGRPLAGARRARRLAAAVTAANSLRHPERTPAEKYVIANDAQSTVSDQLHRATAKAGAREGQIRHRDRCRSAYEMLQKRCGRRACDGSNGGGWGRRRNTRAVGAIVGTIFGTNVKRGRLSTGQVIARDVTRSVTNKVIGGVVADLGKSVGGSLGASVGRSLVRGALGGLLRR